MNPKINTTVKLSFVAAVSDAIAIADEGHNDNCDMWKACLGSESNQNLYVDAVREDQIMRDAVVHGSHK